MQIHPVLPYGAVGDFGGLVAWIRRCTCLLATSSPGVFTSISSSRLNRYGFPANPHLQEILLTRQAICSGDTMHPAKSCRDSCRSSWLKSPVRMTCHRAAQTCTHPRTLVVQTHEDDTWMEYLPFSRYSNQWVPSVTNLDHKTDPKG